MNILLSESHDSNIVLAVQTGLSIQISNDHPFRLSGPPTARPRMTLSGVPGIQKYAVYHDIEKNSVSTFSPLPGNPVEHTIVLLQ